MSVQSDFASQLLQRVDNEAGDIARKPVVSLSWQWDETSQRCRDLMCKKVAGERPMASKVSMQVMMQTGRLEYYDPTCKGGAVQTSEPFLPRALFLGRQTGDFLLAGLLQSYPVPLEDEALLAQLADGKDVVLTFSQDRASANYKVLVWIWTRTRDVAGMFVHGEACVLHGLHLVRKRPAVGKGIIAACFSFTRFAKNWRAIGTWRREIIKFVANRLRVLRGERPAAANVVNGNVMNILFGEDGCRHRRPGMSAGNPGLVLWPGRAPRSPRYAPRTARQSGRR